MRALLSVLSMLALGFSLPASAQYAPSGDQSNQTILYGVKKNQPPQGMVIEQGAANQGIPTSGTQQMQQLQKNQAGQYRRGGPDVIYRDQKDKGLTVITGPNGTTVCRDASGNVTVCY